MGDAAEFRAMLGVINSGEILPVTDQVFPLAEGRAALERLETADQFGKIVLDTAHR
jgi:NADPH:quinone reductase-like Zn-dependent oxidoreductase